MNIYSVYNRISPHFRRERLRRFIEIMAPTEDMHILDVGGYPWFWTESGFDLKCKFTILNPHNPPAVESYRSSKFNIVVGDGTRLDYADGEFDIVFSNSVIEHLGTAANQSAFAHEHMRVGKRYWMQTPAREFPIEPHLIAPFIHWLPKTIQRRLFRHFTIWGWMTRPTTTEVEAMLDELRLLRRSEVRALFPSGELITERLCGLPKSYIAYGGKLATL